MNTQAEGPLTRGDMQLLAQIGFLAAHSSQQSPARSIFRALRVARPDSVLPFIGLAMTEVAAGRGAEAARLLRDEALREHPGHGQIRAFLGWTLAESGNAGEAAKVLQSVLDSPGEDGPHVEMARKLMSVVRPGRATEPQPGSRHQVAQL